MPSYYIDPPTTLEEFNTRYIENYVLEGFGIDGMRTRVPCPFCAEPDFIIYGIADMEAKYAAGAVCDRCKRGLKMLIERIGPMTHYRFIQTEGPPPPSFINRSIERAEEPQPPSVSQ